ncbi:hypothetical protein KOL64_20235 [Providencia rettgeri]|nr:hypothetical protein [Providencia rettgeri]WJM88204.1 hypothetical protein KOL64_20235 [Providencia rettgeri]
MKSLIDSPINSQSCWKPLIVKLTIEMSINKDTNVANKFVFILTFVTNNIIFMNMRKYINISTEKRKKGNPFNCISPLKFVTAITVQQKNISFFNDKIIARMIITTVTVEFKILAKGVIINSNILSVLKFIILLFFLWLVKILK